MALIDPATFPPRPVLFPKFRDRRKIRLVLLLGAALILEAILALIPYIKIRSTDIETRALTVDKSREEKKLETLRSRLLALEQELAILVQTRSPELYRFQLDRVIPINKDGLENVRLTRPGQLGGNLYFVSILATQQSSRIASPAIKISFFDITGVQFGAGNLNPDTPGAPQPGMPASGKPYRFSGQITLNADINPAYFSIAAPDIPAR